MRFCVVVGVVVSLFGFPTPTTGQHVACGGHHIHWIGGAPRASLGREPQDHQPPVREEPAGMDRELWDALVFDAYDNSVMSQPLSDRSTLVLYPSAARGLRFCIQSADESHTGERLQPYSNASWWEQNIRRFANSSWNGEIRVAACTGDPPSGWVHIREARAGEVGASRLAQATSWRRYDVTALPHTQWVSSEIVWNQDLVSGTREDWFESTLAHELGHVLGLWHTPPGSGFVMGNTRPRSWPDRERWMAQWAYAVGPNVQYPGFIRGMPVPVLPFVGLLLLAGLLTAMAWRTSRVKKPLR